MRFRRGNVREIQGSEIISSLTLAIAVVGAAIFAAWFVTTVLTGILDVGRFW